MNPVSKVRSLASFLLLLLLLTPLSFPSASAYDASPARPARTKHQPAPTNRRAFLATSSLALATASTLAPCPNAPNNAYAATAAPTSSAKIKVTPLAHTFVTSSDKGVKPLRENDATRFLTNARIVVPFYGGAAVPDQLVTEVLDLTVKRKEGKGAGVTPGTVHLAQSSSTLLSVPGVESLKVKDATAQSIAAAVSSLPDDDVLFAPPVLSGGTASDGRYVADVAKAAGGLDVGGAKSGGVLGLLLNGPRDPDALLISEGGYDAQTILWYDF